MITFTGNNWNQALCEAYALVKFLSDQQNIDSCLAEFSGAIMDDGVVAPADVHLCAELNAEGQLTITAVEVAE
ncbi:hypothetical protein [Pseudomonas sp. R5(2019)]|uniref:hypothetical protein n=1 Tax=Pseudomonas sp. R5(2019) TaxID=2697566 RepID=UPI001413361A|nr:hypothetical protein [Pseudomonas sp. R5(2019)]NBA96077.1 hypothetical protein [Pseudomonas sp. R5(2019)]